MKLFARGRAGERARTSRGILRFVFSGGGGDLRQRLLFLVRLDLHHTSVIRRTIVLGSVQIVPGIVSYAEFVLGDRRLKKKKKRWRTAVVAYSGMIPHINA